MNYSRIYEITTSTPQQDAIVNAALPNSNDDDAHRKLFDALRATFHTSPRRQFGVFDPATTDAALANNVRDYRDKKLDTENFGLQLAQQFLRGLENNAQPQPWYLWFIIEANNDDEFVYVFLLRHDESYRIGSHRTVAMDGTVETSRVQYAAKVSLREWQSGESSTYLSYLSPKNQLPVTTAWRALIGFAENTERAAKTEEFLGVLDQYAEALPVEKERDYRERVVNYCRDQERAGEPVELRALSRHVNEEAPEELLNFLVERIEQPAPALYADRTQLKRYTRLYGRDQDLSISFSTMMLGRHITYDEKTDTLTIKAIPKSLKSQLTRHLKK